MDFLAYIPSPSSGELEIGPLPLRGYALCILLGIFLAVWLGGRRWVARGGRPGTVTDIAVWAVPFGLVGGRIYHVITDYQLYFGEGRDWVDAFKIWEGGLGIWGAIAFGAVGAWIGCRQRGIPLPAYADAIAPGIALAQAVGRWGNWFNQELYGRATDVPWAVEIDNAVDSGTFHPTFLYESLWCVGLAFVVIWADRRFQLGHGRVFALYVAGYTVGRFWIEYMRIDQAHEILGLRLNNWTALLVFLGAVAYLVLSSRYAPGREEVVEPGANPSSTAPSNDAKAAGSETDSKADAEAANEDAGSDTTAEPADQVDAAEAGGRRTKGATAQKPARNKGRNKGKD